LVMVTICQTTRCHNPHDHKIKGECFGRFSIREIVGQQEVAHLKSLGDLRSSSGTTCAAKGGGDSGFGECSLLFDICSEKNLCYRG
jgi:hypothetical protein